MRPSSPLVISRKIAIKSGIHEDIVSYCGFQYADTVVAPRTIYGQSYLQSSVVFTVQAVLVQEFGELGSWVN